jgi:hypothetical protein
MILFVESKELEELTQVEDLFDLLDTANDLVYHLKKNGYEVILGTYRTPEPGFYVEVTKP